MGAHPRESRAGATRRAGTGRARCAGARRSGARRVLPVATAVLAVLLPAGCAGADRDGAAPHPPEVQRAAGDRASADDPGRLPAATTFADLPQAPPDPAPNDDTTGVVLNATAELPVHDAPGGAAFAKLPTTQLENPTWVPVLQERGDWAQVLLPSRPNGSSGWVRTDSDVQKAISPYSVDVDIDRRHLEIREGERTIAEWTVGVGSPETPTPRGRSYVMAAIEETETRFSPVILPLGAHSDTFNSYGGGPGTVALHGWPEPDVFGRADSDGCVRVPDEALQALSELPLGTIVHLR